VSVEKNIIKSIHKAAKKKILFLPHAIRQMSRPERMISLSEIRSVLEKGEVIEDYPDDARGHSCLVLGFGEDKRPIHIVCSPKEDYLAIITAYLPDKRQWEDNFRKRRKI
jgi:hypothetical protein